MKRIFFASVLLLSVTAAIAQRTEKEEKTGGFKKENLFTGGDVTAAFYSGGTVLGISPTFGYSINKIIDAGIIMNFTYTGERDYTGEKYRQFVYGPGVFARVYPIKMLFIQSNFEHNFTSETDKLPNNGPTFKRKVDDNSLLLGGGYCGGREGTGSTFFYISVMFDVLKDKNSPYVSLLQDGTYRAEPIIKAGVQIGLFQGDKHQDNRRRRFNRFD